MVLFKYEALSVSCEVGVQVVVGGHNAVGDNSKSNKEWEKEHF